MILGVLFGVVIPYAAVIIFICGMIYRIVRWANSAQPLKIPTTGGQAYTLPFIRRTIYDKLDSPFTKFGAFIRVLLEVFLFRSLMRNTRYYIDQRKSRDARWLWLFALLFHYSLLIVLIRHSRFFLYKVPEFIRMEWEVEALKGVYVPTVYITGILIVVALFYLWFRRIFLAKERAISLPSDHFVLILLLAITISGNIMRYFIKVDIESVKELIMSLTTFNIAHAVEVADKIQPMFYIHFLLACFLLAYFPFSKLTHMVGIFFSPTRNMPNNCRYVRYINPWDPNPTKPLLVRQGLVVHMDYQRYYEMYKDQLDEIAERGYKVGGEE